MPYKKNASPILNKILEANNILLISHEKPDGDTLGSGLALSRYFTNLKKNHHHFCINKPAQYFNFLPDIEHIKNDFNIIDLNDYDLIITIDCGELKRTGLAEELIKLKNSISLINIDHHYSNDNYGHLNLVETTASSTSEIIYKFFNFHNIEIDKYIATNLLTGILTDTVNFTNSSTNQDSIEIAARLIDKGARYKQIINQLTKNKKIDDLRLWGKILSNLEYNEKYNFAYTVIKQEYLDKYGLSLEATDGLANFLSTMDQVDFILVLSEDRNNKIKGSFRTIKDDIDVSKLAAKLGGGGHRKSAGFSIQGELLKTADGWQIK